jgi:hypothetical protein
MNYGDNIPKEAGNLAVEVEAWDHPLMEKLRT